MTEEGFRITPAALRAFLDGDLENALISSTPGGIEAQEARGQQDFVASETLPIIISYGNRRDFEDMGIVFGEDADDLFRYVQLPDGWRKEPTDHSMHSHLLDEKGRKRASIFYKAAFYDRSANLSISRRFSYCSEPVRGYDDPDYRTSKWEAVVTDCEKVVWSSDEKLEPQPDGREASLEWYDAKDELAHLGKAWLEEHYPDWRDPTAYWD